MEDWVGPYAFSKDYVPKKMIILLLFYTNMKFGPTT
jgi:hypothetical protein